MDRGSSFKFMAMDISELEFADGEFNVVIDKATLDSVLVNLSFFCFSFVFF